MRKSSLGRRRSNAPSERLSRAGNVDRASNIPRPGFTSRTSRSSSETRKSPGADQRFLTVPSLRRTNSQLSMSGVQAFQTPLRGASSANASTIRSFTPGSEASGFSNIKNPGKPRKDSRNLTDKAFMTQEIHRITNYFSDKPILASLAPKGLQLRQLMLKTFVELVNFLVVQLDSTSNITMANYIEEIPFIMRKLGYPGTINNSWLKTANTQHSLPHVLGLLSWLVSVVEAIDLSPEEDGFGIPDEDEDEDVDDGMFPYGNAKIYFDQFVSQYKSWNYHPESVDKEMKEFINHLSELNGLTQEHIDRLAAEVKQFEEDFNDPKKCAEREALKELQKKSQALHDALKQKMEYKTSAEDCLNNVETQLVTLEQNCRNEEEALAKLEAQRAAVYEQMSNQTMSPEQRDELVRNCEDLKKQIRSKEENIKVIQEENFKDDLRLSKIREQLRKKTQEYNNTILKEACFLPEIEGLLLEDNCLRPGAVEQLDHIAQELQQLKEKLCSAKLEINEKRSNAKLLNAKMEDELSKLAEDINLVIQTIQQREGDLEACMKLVSEEGTKLKAQISHLEREMEALLRSDAEKENMEILEKLIEERDDGLAQLEDYQKKAQEFFRERLNRHKYLVASVLAAEKAHRQLMEELVQKM